jgi:DNA-binding NtrC family response regulator
MTLRNANALNVPVSRQSASLAQPDTTAPARPRPSSAPATVLLVEDKDSLRTMLRHALEAQGHHVVEAKDQPEAVQRLKDSAPVVVLSDLRLPEGDGFGVLTAAKDTDPEMPVIVMTAYGGIQEAVAAMKAGAMDFLAKPVDPDHLLLLVERALSQRRLVAEYALLKEELAARRGAPTIIGEAPVMRQVSTALQRAAGTDATVLIEGESGTGKELFARAVHALSDRCNGPFIAINCAAIPGTLLEAELFGYERGAFTGAMQRKPGKFELAHRGTLFLDEIGELPLALQGKILRALESRTFDRLGGTATIKVDVRLVAATNRHLKQAVAMRQFREDLYFRLSVFPITVPALRERRDDIPILARHFIEKGCRELGKKVLTISPAALEAMMAYPWPGNVRELQNCIERVVILIDGDVIYPKHLNLHAEDFTPPDNPLAHLDLSGSLAEVTARAVLEVERQAIREALAECNGDVGRAADRLQIPYRVLTNKIKALAL